MLIAILEDRVFRKRTKEPYQKRWTVRCFVYNENDELVFLRIKGTDALGRRNHVETIGGGVENEESLEDAVKREIREEIGYECEIIEDIGYIVDHYNSLNRETISNYFAVKLTEYIGGESRTEEEEALIEGTETYSESEVMDMLKDYTKRSVNELVQRRDLIAFEYYIKHKKH
ncbi:MULTISPECIES: NUDIX hydrolase [Breznakia]|uniref:NUDIX domain-containing protein n=1 Tax=Breznakia blatticola TaxID=1754012 RepID=A0A4R7Z848_9FIRM|nr:MULTISPECIES: NUDIX hydrolase [Breznakia]MDH6367791.1 8-oxo-dGTP diphosphatase [Breznakia sp. PH1-1]MDH6404855.1 8-oxo-dGTP diphosphatase [Breznakia sp. PF1-11]MDH6412570.1 8-oxo-dGTP diphosphatase [Breznakia sp. PFB1-11]MDH6414954.1 8-oxo-dGTP diphosphatase [Breznakia sp. PFB1-14]MDH6417265.1 8-oxo-dGTP diphosphatase [Breznakia sp. PFB1-4]